MVVDCKYNREQGEYLEALCVENKMELFSFQQSCSYGGWYMVILIFKALIGACGLWGQTLAQF